MGRIAAGHAILRCPREVDLGEEFAPLDEQRARAPLDRARTGLAAWKRQGLQRFEQASHRGERPALRFPAGEKLLENGRERHPFQLGVQREDVAGGARLLREIADDVTDLVFVNMKGPDYTAHAHGPDSAEQRETLAELDRQLTAYLALIDKKAGPQRSVTIVTADHGAPPEPPPGGRVYLDEVIAQLNKKFDAEGKFINYYNDAANNQLHLDTARLQSLGFSLKDVAAFLEGLEAFEAAFTEDEVKAAIIAGVNAAS